MDIASQEQSPFKLVPNDQEKKQIFELLQECSNNIQKLGFRHSNTKNLSANESPIKSFGMNTSKAAICLVDLSKKEELEDSQPLRIAIDEKDIINEDEENQEVTKNIPNVSSSKDISPFKGFSGKVSASNNASYKSSPVKNEERAIQDSNNNLVYSSQNASDTSVEMSKNPFQYTNDNLLQSSVSVSDTSCITDPFRALCRVKEEFIFVFSGFNDQKLLSCEALDV